MPGWFRKARSLWGPCSGSEDWCTLSSAWHPALTGSKINNEKWRDLQLQRLAGRVPASDNVRSASAGSFHRRRFLRRRVPECASGERVCTSRPRLACQHAIIGQNTRTLEQVVKLAHLSRPRVQTEGSHGLRRSTIDLLSGGRTSEGRRTVTLTRASHYFWRGPLLPGPKAFETAPLLIAWGRRGAMRMKEPGLTWTVSLPRSTSASPSST